MTYTLILTMSLFFSGYKQAAAQSSIEAIPGFATHTQCVDAGNQWIAQQRKVGVRGTLAAMCVAQGRDEPRKP